MFNRRTFLKTGLTTGAAIPLSSTLGALAAASPLAAETVNAGSAVKLAALPVRLAPVDPAKEPWQQRIRRVAQTNMTEHDPAVMNVEEWADYWHSAQADIVFVSVTGILAFYPSKVKFHRHGKFLKDRDFFGECLAAAKKRGMRVVARMSPDLNWGDALEAHPDWAMRYKDSSVQYSGEEPRLFKTCMFSAYMDDYVPAIMREINSLYDIDCFYTNGWPPIGSLPGCYCAICSKLPPTDTSEYWRVFNDRVFELWSKYDSIAKEKKPDSFYFANLGGNVHPGPNLDRIGKLAVWFQADNQGRTYDDPAIWGCTLQSRACNAVLDGKFSANVAAAYSTGIVRWRNSSKNPAEAKMWMNEALAGGMALYYHFIGSEDGLGEDRRWQKVGADYFRWAAKYDAHLTTRRSIANIGVVMGQSTQLLYKGPATAHSRQYMRETTHGLYEMLLSGRFAFDFVHEDRLESERLSRYRALLLPNIAMLSTRQCQQIRDYVQSGGSIMASFETGLYDENLKQRGDFGLSDLLGISKAGDVVGTIGNAYYGRIEAPAPDSCRLREHQLDSRRTKPCAAQAHSGTRSHRRPRLRAVSAGAGLSSRLAYSGAGHSPARDRPQSHRLFPRRHRADLVADWPWRPPAAPAQHDPLDYPRRENCPRPGRRLRRDFCLGDGPRLLGARAQLHQPKLPPWVAAVGSIRSARRPSA